MYAVFQIEFVHGVCVIPDDRDVDDQRPLRPHIELEWKTKEGDRLKVSGEPADDESGDEPDHQQKRCESEILLPILFVFFSKLHVPPVRKR